jgi:hypothetical protein
MRTIAPLIGALALSACAVVPTDPGSRRAELAWQALNVADTVQTLQVAQHPQCWREANPLSRALIGEHPSSGEVGVLMVTYAYTHAAISTWLDAKTRAAIDNDSGARGAWYTGRIIWHVAGLLTKGTTVANNANLGLWPNGAHCDK